MNRTFAMVVVAAQVAVLAFMACQREWVSRTGRVIFLRVDPIDPTEPMRGEYLHLNYEISRVPAKLCTGGIPEWFGPKPSRINHKDTRVYAALVLDQNGLANLVSLSDERPASGLYVMGRVESTNDRAGEVAVRYGLNAFFVEEGGGKAFSEKWRREMTGAPLDSEVAVSPSGLAVLKGYHWEPLGMHLSLELSAQQPRVAGRPLAARHVTGATVEIKNLSSGPVAIVVSPLRLVYNAQRNTNHYRWVGEAKAAPRPTAEDIRVLRPGESYRQHLDLMAREWYVSDTAANKGDGSPVAVGYVQGWDASFRMEYDPPSAEDCAGLPNAGLVWHSRVLSQAFGSAGTNPD